MLDIERLLIVLVIFGLLASALLTQKEVPREASPSVSAGPTVSKPAPLEKTSRPSSDRPVAPTQTRAPSAPAQKGLGPGLLALVSAAALLAILVTLGAFFAARERWALQRIWGSRFAGEAEAARLMRVLERRW